MIQDFQRKKKVRKFLYSRNVVIVLAIIAVLLLRGAIGVIGKQRLSEKNVVALRQELVDAQKRSGELDTQITSLKTDAGVEREIRAKFSVTKPGEEVAVIVDPKPAQPVATSTELGFWGSIGAWFKKIF